MSDWNIWDKTTKFLFVSLLVICSLTLIVVGVITMVNSSHTDERIEALLEKEFQSEEFIVESHQDSLIVVYYDGDVYSAELEVGSFRKIESIKTIMKMNK